MSRSSTLNSQHLLERIETIFETSQNLRFLVAKDTGWFSIEDETSREIQGIIRDTAELLREVMEFYEVEKHPRGELDGANDETEVLKEIGAQISSELATREVSDLAFVARSQLLEIETVLKGALARQEVWKVASGLDAGLRSAKKALVAAESAIREYEGLPARERHWVDLEDSLQIRRLYGQFRRAILRGNEADGKAMRAELRKAANRIAILRDLKIYPFLRIDDRLQIRQLQKRILAWLEAAGDTADEEVEASGRRLWQDLVAFASLLKQVNNRQELREHDRRAVIEIYHRLFHPRGLGPKGGERADLEPLLGRDDDLDQIILGPGEYRTEDLRSTLERLQRELAAPTSFL